MKIITTILSTIIMLAFQQALCLPAPEPANEPVQTFYSFSLIAVNRGSPIHLKSLNANERGIWIGKHSLTDCPEAGTVIKFPCANVTKDVTVFACASQDGLETACSMHARVPGGQELYINIDGALSYTAPHSVQTAVGPWTDGFEYKLVEEDRGVSDFRFVKGGCTGWIACASPFEEDVGPWQVFAELASVETYNDNCFHFDAYAFPTNVAAWEYT